MQFYPAAGATEIADFARQKLVLVIYSSRRVSHTGN